jgi:hypothetical protein
LQQHFAEDRAKVILWSNAVDRGVGEMLMANFPSLRIVRGDDVPDPFQEADFFLHGSGPSVVARNHLEAWRKQTGKPYGIAGVTIAAIEDGLRGLLSQAAFVYTAETKSLENMKQASIRGPAMGFAPDGAFSLKLSNETAAKAFLDKHALEPRKFIAAVPSLQHTPHLPKLQHAMIAWMRETGNKVLLCAEAANQVDLLKSLLYDPLPADVKKNIVRQEQYWIPDMASSLYRRARAVLSFDCHSPIIAAVNDTPGVYLRRPEDGIKGQMWTDIGLGRWALPMEQTDGDKITDTLMAIHKSFDVAQVHTHEAVVYARRRQSEPMEHLRNALGI